VHVPICFLSRQRAVDAAAIEGRRAAARRGVSVAARATGAAVRPPAAWTGGSSGRLAAAETNRDGSRHYDGATSSRQPAITTIAEPKQRHPLEPSPTPDPALRPHHIRPSTSPPTTRPPRRLDGSRTAPHLIAHPGPLLPCSDCAAPPPRPDQLPPGLTHQVYLDGRGRGASATRWPPFLESPGGSEKRPGAGRRPVRA
jgi:hypothetical protein